MSKFLRPVRLSDITHVERHMRKADVAECRAHGLEPGLALLLSAQYSEQNHTIVAPDGEPLGICGLTPGNAPGDKMVWMLGTDGLMKHKRTFLQESRVWIEEQAKRFVLWNYVDSRNTVHVRWLKWVGAQFIGSKTSPYTGSELLLFTKVSLCA
jgi:hypothetical protein